MRNNEVNLRIFRWRHGRVTSFVPVFAAVFVMVILHGGCASRPDTAQNTSPVISGYSEAPSGGPIIESDSYESTDEIIEKDLQNFSKILQLAELPKTPESDRFEFRLWTHLGGLGDARLLAVRADSIEFHADFIVFGKRDGKMVIEKTKPGEPRSGWQGITFPFTSRLTTPHGLSRDPSFNLQRDEPVILLEVIQRGEYRRIFYGQTTKFADGIKLKETCKFIEGEFNVNLDCY